MTQILIGVLLSGLPHLLCVAGAAADEARCVTATATVASSPAMTDHVTSIAIAGNGIAGVPRMVASTAPVVLAAQASDAKPHTVRVTVDTSKKKGQHGWLGVAIGEIPEALVAQLDTGGKGVLVVDVVKDSPADRAGVEVHDIIVSVDGRGDVADMRRLSEAISRYKPGDEIEVTVLRDGKENTIEVELAARPSRKVLKWIIDGDPLAEIEERVKTRGRIIGQGPGGKFFIKDLGDLDALKDLPEELRAMIPDVDNQSIKVFVDGNQTRINTVFTRGDETVKVERIDGGEITVTRTVKGGDDVETVYENDDALRQGDPEAADLLAQTSGQVFIHLDVDEDEDENLDDNDFDFDFNFDGLDGDISNWREQFEARLGEIHEAMEGARGEAREALERALEHLHEGRSDGGRKWKQDLHDLYKSKGGAYAFFQAEKPRWSFDVQTDGSITARTRKSDTEVTRQFESEADLERRAPKLFEKYDEAMSAADAE